MFFRPEKHLKTKKLKSAFNLKERWEICAFKIIVATQPVFFLLVCLTSNFSFSQIS